jgi:RNA polymerase sigma factor (sigma-70 family)
MAGGVKTLDENVVHVGSAAQAPLGLSDEDLLCRYLAGPTEESEAAFTDLVARHGPMVLAVCRHILGRDGEAEDAFQATFLVLARNAAAIHDRRVIARWLYEVAYRTAVRARVRSGRRRIREKEAAEMSALGYPPESDPAWNELRPVLHEEVSRLPETYRSAVVLCYLEGRTNEEAAAILRWPIGTVKGRLSRAREMLRSRLTRRGLALSAAFLMARLSQNAVFAEVVPASLTEATARGVVAAARGGPQGVSTLSPRILDLADGESPDPGFTPTVRGIARTLLAVVAAAILILGLSAGLSRGQGISGLLGRIIAPPSVVGGRCH